MFPTLLALLLTGQCAGGSCAVPTRSYAPLYVPQPQYRVVQPAPVQKPQPHGIYKTKYQGLVLEVFGVKLASGDIEWEPDAPFNADAIATAKRAASAVAKAAVTNFGLTPDKIGKTVGFSGNVHEYQQAKTGKPTRDGKIFLTVIGNPSDRKSVVDDWHSNPEFADLRDSVHFGEFERNAWQVKDELGYAATGKPTILIQQPSGRVEYRAYDYSGGAKELAQALRRADPKYSPERDPGPTAKAHAAEYDSYVLVGAVLLGALLLIPKRRVT
jgi:hypothetical protein